ncbi:MAG: anthranilate synthase component I family protein [Phycisphaerales bacterium]|nr:anthranilate synthase component I family protein [Phycisphaerales bacterium]
MTAHPIQLELTPERALAAWPGDWPLAALWSGDQAASRSRWTLLARPSRTLTIRAGEVEPGAGPVAVSQCLLPRIGLATTSLSPEAPPFSAGWIGSLAYDAGRAIEPRAGHGPPRTGGWPVACWARCDDVLIFDHAQLRWWAVGDPELGTALRISAGHPLASSFTLSPLSSLTGRARYMADVARVLEYIRAGDIYQANLAHALEGRFWGSTRGLFADLAARARPWYGAYLELADGGSQRVMLSLSPELFLSLDPATRLIETRPMKGTRPASTDPRELELAHKDRAELNMIIDLQRNDLGRVCEYGSVKVTEPRVIERHGAAGPSLLQATATVTGRLRAGLGPDELIAAAFPGGSITGAPKIRAMQIIDELEPAPRGPYCGAMGWLGDDGRLSLNIAIRTAVISSQAGGPAQFRNASLSYSVGAGIVADSSPEAEWAETLDKASLWSGLATIEDR